MQIDFNSLSYKIPKPEIKLTNTIPYIYQNSSKIQIKHYLDFQDTQTSNYEQQTINPFRRTNHLFKHKHIHTQNDKKLSARTSIINNKTNINDINDLNDLNDLNDDDLNYDNKIQWSISSRSQPYLPIYQQQQPTVYSLQNFDSFKNNSKAQQIHISKQIIQNTRIKQSNSNNSSNYNKVAVSIHQIQQIHQSQFIKIQGSSLSDQFSLIMDDFNCQMKCSDLIPNSNTRRIKTQYCQIEKQWEQEEDVRDKREKMEKMDKLCFNQIKKQKNIRKKQSSGIFCLTAQQEESSCQSNVKQFYFDLRKQQQKLQTKSTQQNQLNEQTEQNQQINTKQNIFQNKSIKKQLKQLIYNFIDDLDIMEEHQIDPQFIERIQKCLFTVKKIPPLHPHVPCCQITPQKWVKVNRNNSCSNSKQKNKFIPSKPSPTLHSGISNKMNKQNTMFTKNVINQSSKKKKQSQQNVSSLFHGDIKKKKWAL